MKASIASLNVSLNTMYDVQSILKDYDIKALNAKNSLIIKQAKARLELDISKRKKNKSKGFDLKQEEELRAQFEENLKVLVASQKDDLNSTESSRKTCLEALKESNSMSLNDTKKEFTKILEDFTNEYFTKRTKVFYFYFILLFYSFFLIAF